MTAKAVFFTSLVPEIAQEITAPAPSAFRVEVHPHDLPPAQKAALAVDADFLVLFPSEIEPDVLQAATRLKLIQLVSAGFDKMPLDVLTELHIPLANNGGANAIDVAEHTLSLILAVYRRLPEMDHNVRNQGWRAIDSGLTTYTVHGKTVGIVGLGHIGREVARRLAPFGADLLYYDPFPAPPEVEQALGVTRVGLDDLLRDSDIVTLHVPLNEHTRGLIGARELGLMQPTAVLINTCRGPVVDEAALTEALQKGALRAAGLDVLADEPPDPANPLLRLENVVFTPHIAGVTWDTWRRRGAFIFANLQRAWNGEQPLAIVN